MNNKNDFIDMNTVLKYLFLVALGFFANQIFFNNNKDIENKSKESDIESINSLTKEIRLKEEFTYINPLLECSDSIGGNYIPDSLKIELNEYIKKHQEDKSLKNVSVYFRDLNNGPWFGINEKELFTPASLTKVPMMMLYFKKAESNPNVLNQRLTIDPTTIDLYESQITVPENKLIGNNQYTLQELIEHMIYYSDNVAYSTLKNNLKEYELNKLFLDFGIDISARIKGPNEDMLSVREYASFFRILYNSSYLNRKYSEKALNILSNTEYNKGLVAGVGDNTIVAHKFGERQILNQNQLHDCGIVYKNNNPYLLCIMSRGGNQTQLATVIEDISRMIYKYRN